MKQSAAAAANQQNQQSANSTWAADPEARAALGHLGRAHAATLTLSGLHRLRDSAPAGRTETRLGDEPASWLLDCLPHPARWAAGGGVGGGRLELLDCAWTILYDDDCVRW